MTVPTPPPAAPAASPPDDPRNVRCACGDWGIYGYTVGGHTTYSCGACRDAAARPTSAPRKAPAPGDRLL